MMLRPSLQVRAGTGGDEAAIWAGDILGAYLKYAQAEGWKTRIIEESQGTEGGYKSVTLEVNGEERRERRERSSRR